MAEILTSPEVGMVGRIPVRNLWLLMLYASRLEVETGKSAVRIEDAPDDIPNLVAELLAFSVENRLRRHLSFGYSFREASLSRVRGKIDVLKTECHQLLSRGLVACRFEELTIDTPRNRFVRAALDAIARLVTEKTLRNRCRSLSFALRGRGVTGPAPTRSEIELIRFGRHDADDQTMIVAAKLVFDLSLPTEEAGSHTLPIPDREEKWVRRLFEKAVGGFYRKHLVPKGWRVVCGETLQWPIQWKSSGMDQILPLMKTDVVLEKVDEGKRIVIDTKFNEIVTNGWFRKETLRSGYLYQMYAYLRSQEVRGEAMFDRAEGVLLHPAVGEWVDESVVIQGHRLRFVTVDLSASARNFREQLLGLVETETPAFEKEDGCPQTIQFP
jgi:5-methylcytosine-specific restriction enzyme subunit McrC